MTWSSRESGAETRVIVCCSNGLRETRILVTMDKDFGEFVFRERAGHSGLVRLPDVPAETRVRLMERVLREHGGELVDRAIVTVRGGRIRISRFVSG